MPRYKIAFGIGDDPLPETQVIVDTDDWDDSNLEAFKKMLSIGKGSWKIYPSPNPGEISKIDG